MILHPFLDRHRLTVIAGRLLNDTFDLVGQVVDDADNPQRKWKIHSFFVPLEGRKIGGVRARAVDQKDFVSFINQRDLEVLIGHAKPGDYCKWLGEDYVSPYEREWVGFCADSQDLMDDTYVREMEYRDQYFQMGNGTVLPTGLELQRRIHIDTNNDVEELLFLRGDYDFMTGAYPDSRLETVDDRWTRVERRAVSWRRL